MSNLQKTIENAHFLQCSKNDSVQEPVLSSSKLYFYIQYLLSAATNTKIHHILPNHLCISLMYPACVSFKTSSLLSMTLFNHITHQAFSRNSAQGVSLALQEGSAKQILE